MKNPANILWMIVAGLVAWTVFLAAGASIGPTAAPTGEPIEKARDESGEPVALSSRGMRNKVLRPIIVLGSTAGLLAFWGLMFQLRARRLARQAANRQTNEVAAATSEKN